MASPRGNEEGQVITRYVVADGIKTWTVERSPVNASHGEQVCGVWYDCKKKSACRLVSYM